MYEGENLDSFLCNLSSVMDEIVTWFFQNVLDLFYLWTHKFQEIICTGSSQNLHFTIEGFIADSFIRFVVAVIFIQSQ